MMEVERETADQQEREEDKVRLSSEFETQREALLGFIYQIELMFFKVPLPPFVLGIPTTALL